MAIGVTGSKVNGTVSSYSNNQLVISGASLVSNDYSSQRIVGIWSSSSVYKGMAYVRRFVNSTTLEMEQDFFDDDGNSITLQTGDLFLVSLNYSDVSQTGLLISGNLITQSQSVTFGTAGVSDSVCFYDENKFINIANDEGTQAIKFAGGLCVFGHLNNYEDRTFFNSVSLSSSDGGASGDQIVVINESAKSWWMGGILSFQITPARLPGGGSSAARPAEWQKWWGIQTNADVVTPSGGAPWSSNASKQQFVNIQSLPSSPNAIGFRLANSDFQGGSCKISGGNVISAFGSDASGSFTIGAPAGQRFNVIDIGTNLAKTAFWRSNGLLSQNIIAQNIISADYRCGTSTQPGTNANNNATVAVNFLDLYTNAVNETHVIIKQLSNGNVADSGIVSGGQDLSLSVNYSNTVGHVNTVNETNWEWGAYKYGKDFVGGTFSVSIINDVDGNKPNVIHGAQINQVEDIRISKHDNAVEVAYHITLTLTRTSIVVNGDSNILRELSSNQLYDAISAFLEDNPDSVNLFPLKSGNTLDFGSRAITLNYITFNSDDLIKTTGTLTLQNGSTANFLTQHNIAL